MPEPGAAGGPAILLRELGKRFRDGREALDKIDLELRTGTLTALVGPNGSGKSTLLALLAGRLRASRGSLRVLGDDPGRAGRHFRRRVTLAPQELALDSELTAQETIELFAALHGLRAGKAERLRWAESFGLGAHLEARVETHSGGLKQRLHVLLAFLAPAELLLLDEPTTALDREGRALVWQLLCERRKQGLTAIVATHDLRDVEALCDSVVVMQAGRIVACASPAELVREHASPTLRLRIPDDAPDVASRLSELPCVRAVRPRPDRLELMLEPNGDVDANLVEVLRAAGPVVTSWELRKPDLETACAALVGELDGPRAGRRRREPIG